MGCNVTLSPKILRKQQVPHLARLKFVLPFAGLKAHAPQPFAWTAATRAGSKLDIHECPEWVESGWSAFEFADRVSGREARPSDTASPPPVRASTNGGSSSIRRPSLTIVLGRIVTTPVTASSGF